MPKIKGEVESLTFQAEKLGVPEHLVDGLVAYVAEHRYTGSFLRAVLENDLKGCIERGDEAAVIGLKKVVVFLYNYAPGACWGSAAKVKAWLKEGN